MTLLVAIPNYSAINRDRQRARDQKRFQATHDQLRHEIECYLGRKFDPQMGLFEKARNLFKRDRRVTR